MSVRSLPVRSMVYCHPILGQLLVWQLAFVAVVILFIFTDQAKGKRHYFVACFASRPEGQFFCAGEIKTARGVSPVIYGALPDDTTPAFVGFEIALQAGRAVWGLSVHLRSIAIEAVAHVAGGDIGSAGHIRLIDHQRQGCGSPFIAAGLAGLRRTECHRDRK